MSGRASTALCLLLLAYLVFLAGARNVAAPSLRPVEVAGSVVLPAPLQTLLYLGDPYLAANVEADRVLITGGPVEGIALDYFERLHLTIALLNPCQEDNYYVANGLLAWAGSVDAALAILHGATQCRFWDEIPPFFYGFNLYLFKRDGLRAKDMLFEAARRSSENQVVFKKLGIMYEAETYPDFRAAQKFLIAQRDQSRDSKLRQLLDKRIDRLEGLILLRDAQAAFERRFRRPLKAPDELLASGLLARFPTDPMRLGYIFEGGQFVMREVKIRGVERLRN